MHQCNWANARSGGDIRLPPTDERSVWLLYANTGIYWLPSAVAQHQGWPNDTPPITLLRGKVLYPINYDGNKVTNRNINQALDAFARVQHSVQSTGWRLRHSYVPPKRWYLRIEGEMLRLWIAASNGPTVSCGLHDRSIEVRSPAGAKGFFL
jgi:hypothetical protein